MTGLSISELESNPGSGAGQVYRSGHNNPEPNFAALAKSKGSWTEGPFENGDDLKPALKRAIEQVKQGKPALIDAVCDRRNHG